MHDQPPPEWAAYQAAVTRFTDAIDKVLASGATARRRHDTLTRRLDGFRHTGSVPSDPTQLPPAQQHIHQQIVQMMQELDQRHLGPIHLHPEPAVTTGAAARALGSRHRI